MIIEQLHEWNLSPREAVALQARLSERVREEPLDLARVRTVAGVDLSFNLRDTTCIAGIALLSFPDLELVAETWSREPLSFPYIPGLLSFRELPPLIAVLRRFPFQPDAIICDGQGRAHPRRFGLASHLGLWLGVPTLGCAKSVLCGDYREPGMRRGSRTRIRHKGEVIGSALRTRDGVRPVYISVGHLLDLPSAVSLAMKCHGGYRIPEPVRRAHILVNRARQSMRASPP